MRFLVTLTLLVSLGWAADQKDAANSRAVPKAGNPRQPKMGPPLSNPGSPAARLYRATPEERERALEKLPPRMQAQLREQLQRFDAMPKPQQDILIRRAERFASLTLEQKANFASQMVALRKVPEERRRTIVLALRRLQPLSEDERQKLLNGENFQALFTPEEQKIVVGLAAVMIPPN